MHTTMSIFIPWTENRYDKKKKIKQKTHTVGTVPKLY